MGQDVYIVHMNHVFKKVIQTYKNHDNSRDFLFYIVFIKNFTTLYLFYMANGITYGIGFPFSESAVGNYFNLTTTTSQEIRTDLLHLLFTRKGSRYYLPDFGTRLYEFIFDPLDGETFEGIKSEIQTQVEKYIPNLIINSITVAPYTENEKSQSLSDAVYKSKIPEYSKGEVTTITATDSQTTGGRVTQEYNYYDIFRLPGQGVQDYTAKIKIEYTDNNSSFGSREFIIINI